MPGFEKYGFIKQSVELDNKVGKIKKISSQIYTLNGYNLITTITRRNVGFIQNGDRIIVKDEHGVVIMNMSIYDMEDLMMKKHGDDVEERIFSIKNKGIYCKVVMCGLSVRDAIC